MNKKTGMTPREIRSELVRLGIQVGEIAKQAGVTSSAVSQVIVQYGNYRGYRIRPYIAKAIGKSESEIWPDNAA